MEDLKVTDTTVPGVIDFLKKGEWLVPQFQREFVWSTEQVSGFVQSVLEARPIGMATLWEQSDDPSIQLERVSIPDHDPVTGRSRDISFGPDVSSSKKYAVLDGRQRCTAIAMAFGGFRATHGTYKYSGRYYLDVSEIDSRKRVKYYKEDEINRLHLNIETTCISQGLFPLASLIQDEPIMSQWMRYLQSLQRPESYPDGTLPSAEELQKRNQILQDAFQGIVKTKLAVYIVPEKYSLGDICEIFETLNTTGTKVSTVDLIHSWLYSDTYADAEGPFLLREWIQEMGQKDGAIGWASTDDRPELFAQIITACHVALVSKPNPRPFNRSTSITSVKASDLLATPTQHWKAMKEHEDQLANYIGEAQRVIAGGYFHWLSSPYPASISIYVALRWHAKFDDPDTHNWGIDELDALYRAFFWRNALTRRYDQGFLSQIGTDINELAGMLQTRHTFSSSSEWASNVESSLASLITYSLPSRAELMDMLTDGNQGGALQKSLLLLQVARVKKDLVDAGVNLAFPGSSLTEMHHIFPKEWCRNNRSGQLATVLDSEQAGRDYVNSVANLMPLSRRSNNNWKQKIPSQYITERGLTFIPNEDVLKPLFIDSHAFELLTSGSSYIKEFWEHRAGLIADELIKCTRIVL